MLDRAVARAGYAVYQENEHIGNVTSGAPSPTLKCGIGFASITSQAILDEKIAIEIRGRFHPAKIVKLPFIKNRSYAASFAGEV